MAKRLLLWIERLSNVKAYELLLVCDAGTPFDVVTDLMTIGNQVFKDVHCTTPKEPITGWPRGCNANWMAAMKWGAKNKRDILFLEPDAIPLKPTWLDDLNADWGAWLEKTTDTNYLGNIEACAQLHLPPKVISGVGIYSHRVGEYALVDTGLPWNVAYSDLLIPHGVNSPLIKDFFGQKNLPPVFVKERNEHSPVNALALDVIPPEAVIFHRDKSHGLIPLLRKKLFNEEVRGKIVAVFPVHKGDVELAIYHAQWLQLMNHKWAHRAVIAFDTATPQIQVRQLQGLITPLFEHVELFRYAHVRGGYPRAANFAFQSVAHHMAKGNAPWFWCEADLVVLKADWLEQMQEEYERCGKLWMGSVVHQLGHVNGTAVYPPDAAARMPRTMTCSEGAFDMHAKAEIEHDMHDAGHLLFHSWSILNGQWHPVGGGTVPMNVTVEMAEKIPRSAVTIHRVKDRSLVGLLLTGQYGH